MRPAHTSSYEGFARIWPGRDHPWAARLNTIKKYVFSSTLDDVQWQNSVLISTDAVQEVTKLRPCWLIPSGRGEVEAGEVG